jgi:diguanylate cyclase (GGDEF)-like protein
LRDEGGVELTMLRKIVTLFAVPTDKPELAQAQLHALSKQIPLLYFLLIFNSIIAAYTHFQYAPLLLTVYLPLIFSAICSIRLVSWWNMRHARATGEEAIARLRSTVKLTGVFGFLMTIWAISLLPFGGIAEKTHVAFYMSITTVACVFCLTHLRAAAITLATVIVIPFAMYFAAMGNSVMIAIAVNMVLVAGAMLYTLFIHYGEFTTMVDQRLHLEKVNAETLRLSNENHKFANVDSLTDMPNRRRFFSELEASIAQAEIEKSILAIGLIDLDGFKAVNDLYGHCVGDDLLVEASRRMKDTQNWPAFIARLGGDEFGFILKCEASSEAARAFGQELCNLLRSQYLLGDFSADVSASCGIAVFPENSTNTAKLLEFADYALYQAKSEATGGTVVFTPQHHQQLRSVHQINQALRNADLENEFSLEFQPVVQMPSGKTVSYEALARWNSPILGQVPPKDFIASAERSNLIDRLTVTLFRKFLAHLSDWPEHLTASFNLSARNLASSETALQLVNAIYKSKVSPKRIEFEVTETSVMADYDSALKTLTLLRNLGARIALDDFGTGFSSLGYVHRLPLDKIKIDRGFVSEIHSSEKAKNIVKTIVDMCRNLDVPCVAEGIETQEEADAVRETGCSLMQGFYFGRSILGSEVLEANGSESAVRRKKAHVSTLTAATKL